MLSVKQACQRIGLGKTAFYAFLGAGEIPAIKIGKRTLIAEEALNNFIRRQAGYQATKKKPSQS